jgi:hypothetical protein
MDDPIRRRLGAFESQNISELQRGRCNPPNRYKSTRMIRTSPMIPTGLASISVLNFVVLHILSFLLFIVLYSFSALCPVHRPNTRADRNADAVWFRSLG